MMQRSGHSWLLWIALKLGLSVGCLNRVIGIINLERLFPSSIPDIMN